MLINKNSIDIFMENIYICIYKISSKIFPEETFSYEFWLF